MKNKFIKKFSKRGDISIMTALIIILVIFIVILLLWGLLSIYLSESSSREVCRVSVLAKSLSKLNLADIRVDSPFNLNCPTNFIEIKKTGIFKNDKNKYPRLTQPNVKRAVAEEMKDCWYEFLAGSRDPFGGLLVTKRCVVCAQIDFNKAAAAEIGSVANFKTYLLETKMPGDKKKYGEYLTSKSINTNYGDSIYNQFFIPSSLTSISPDWTVSELTPDQTYSVVFLSFNQYEGNKASANYLSSNTFYYTGVLLVPSDKLTELCDQLY